MNQEELRWHSVSCQSCAVASPAGANDTQPCKPVSNGCKRSHTARLFNGTEAGRACRCRCSQIAGNIKKTANPFGLVPRRWRGRADVPRHCNGQIGAVRSTLQTGKIRTRCEKCQTWASHRTCPMEANENQQRLLDDESGDRRPAAERQAAQPTLFVLSKRWKSARLPTL